jgi:kynurenine formamidase
MLVDITLRITPKMVKNAQDNEKKALIGHLGTHFDVMNKEFPLEYVERKGIVFDVSEVKGKDIDVDDLDIESVSNNMFVAFYTGFIEEVGYGGEKYFKEHPQLSNKLIDALIEKETSIIGIDFAGVRRGCEHTPKDQYCADRGIFIIENLCNLNSILDGKRTARFIANTYPVNYAEISGLPCRVVAKI